MKLLHLNNVYRPIGGSELYLYGICRELKKLGLESSIVHGSSDFLHDPDAVTNSYYVSKLDEFGGRTKRQLKAELQNIMDREKPGLILLHNIHNPDVTEIVTCFGRVIKFVHDHELYCPKTTRMIGKDICTNCRPLNCVTKTLLSGRCSPFMGVRRRPWTIIRSAQQMFFNHAVHKKVDLFLVGTNFMKNTMVCFGYDAEKIVINPNFTFFPGHNNEGSEQKNILFVGRIDPAKGLDLLVDILRRVEIDFKAFIIGTGSPEYEAALQEEVRKSGLSERVAFTGWIDNDKLAQYYKDAAVVAVPSIWPEPFGLVGIEAMAQSRPVVAFDVGGISEWLEDKKTGFLVRRGDTEAFAEKIDLLLQDFSLRRTLGQNAYKRAAGLFNKQRHMEKLVSII